MAIGELSEMPDSALVGEIKPPTSTSEDADWIRLALEGYEANGWKDDPDISQGWIVAAHLAQRLQENLHAK